MHIKKHLKKHFKPTYTLKNHKSTRILGIGFKEIKFFIIIFWIVKYCIKNKINPTRLSKLNPGLYRGGNSHASKNTTYEYITLNNSCAKKYFAKQVYIPKKSTLSSFKNKFLQFENNSNNPIVLKPDQGARSIGVIITKNDEERKSIFYARKNTAYIAQEYISYPYELGVYYYKYPNQDKGKILGIAEKKFRIIIGDGKKSLKELTLEMTLNESILTQLKHNYPNLKYIPKYREKITLAGIADHDAQGDYYDRPDLITQKVVEIFNNIIGNKKVYFCRFDIRANSIEEFAKGKLFKILELNCGPDAVLLHNYDPRYSIRKQLKKDFEGYKLAFNIANEVNNIDKNNKEEKLFSYLWFLTKDEIPLFFLKHRIKRTIRKSRLTIKNH
jgi:hypothetical protein